MTDTSASELIMGTPSFKFNEIGTAISGEIVGLTKEQATDYTSGAPRFLDNGEPEMYPVITLQLDNGTKELVHLSKAGQRVAVGKAVREAGAQEVTTGARLTLTYSGEEPSRRPGFKSKKIFTAEYEPPTEEVNEVV